MATPGIGDPYWFEWYVGLKNIINMLNPDNGIEYVIFQCSKYNTIDDVVVGYKDGGHEICYQINLVFQKTQGNNLSAVFAVEELKKLSSLEEVVSHFEKSHISADIQQYYHHMWNFVKHELSSAGLNILYPESVVDCSEL